MSEAGIWNRLAGRYDLVVRLFDRSYPEVRRRLAVDVPEGSHVLEVAAGTGQFTTSLARGAAKVTATDISAEMVRRLDARVAASGLDNVECCVMSAYEIDAEDASFDVVFCANALHVMTDPGLALGEFRRVLRNGGILIAPTFLHGAGGARIMLSRTLSAFSPFVAHTRLDLAALTALVGDHGFEVDQVEQLPGLFPLAYVVARRPGAPATSGRPVEPIALIFWSNVAIQLLLIAGAVWSIALPARRVYPMQSTDFFYYSMWALFWVVLAQHAALVVLDWDSGSWASPRRLVVGIPIALLGAALVSVGIITNGVKNTSALPGELVTGGPYRLTRNPQYVGDIALFLGVSIIANSELVWLTHALTSLMLVLAPFAEEPWLEQQYGEAYREYRSRVPRFL